MVCFFTNMIFEGNLDEFLPEGIFLLKESWFLKHTPYITKRCIISRLQKICSVNSYDQSLMDITCEVLAMDGYLFGLVPYQ